MSARGARSTTGSPCPASSPLISVPSRHTSNLATATDSTLGRVIVDVSGEHVEDYEARRLAAVRLGGVRLIDNVSLASLP